MKVVVERMVPVRFFGRRHQAMLYIQLRAKIDTRGRHPRVRENRGNVVRAGARVATQALQAGQGALPDKVDR
jgi:hypothetical protein